MARKPTRRRMGTTGGKKRNSRKSRAKDRARKRELDEAKKVRRAHRRKRKIIVRMGSFGWRLVKGTSKGTAKRVAKYTPIVYGKARDKVVETKAKQRFPEEYEPEPGEIPDEAWRIRTTYRCCNRRFATPEALNAHHVREHAEDEAEKAARPTPKLVISTTARSAGKRHVQPVKGTPTGRHRARKPGSTRAEALVEAHRETMTKIGEREIMAEVSGPGIVARGFKQMHEGSLPALPKIEATFLGLEMAFAQAADFYENERLKMIQAGYDPAHLHKLVILQELMAKAASSNSSFIATLKEELADAIKAAKERAEGNAPTDKQLLG
jgi:hypothetical protein